MDEAPAVVVVGAACADLVDDDDRGWRLGGGASYSALALARLGLRVGALVVADELAASSTELDMVRDAGVDVRVIPGSPRPGVHQHRDADGPGPADAAGVGPGGPPGAARAWRGARRLDVRAGRRGGPRRMGGRAAAGRAGRARLAGPAARAHGRRARPPPPPGPSPVVRRADLVGVGSDDVDDATTPAHLAAVHAARAPRCW